MTQHDTAGEASRSCRRANAALDQCQAEEFEQLSMQVLVACCSDRSCRMCNSGLCAVEFAVRARQTRASFALV